ncbi:MAG: hypothetical protein V3S02_06205 [Dehalococcoidales bacterium]
MAAGYDIFHGVTVINPPRIIRPGKDGIKKKGRGSGVYLSITESGGS